MPAAHRTFDHDPSVYAQVCRLSTLHERVAASEVVERLVDAGLTYAQAAAAVREQRAAAQPDRAGWSAIMQTLGRTGARRLALPCRGRRR